MSTFDKVMKNRDYWRDETHRGWQTIEALENKVEQLEEQARDLIGDVQHETARADELQELVTSLNYQNHKLHEKAKQHLENFTKEAFANEKQKQAIEFYQLKILNLLRREDGLPEYRTTEEALTDFFNNSGKLDRDSAAPSLFGYPLIIRSEEPIMPKTIEYKLETTADGRANEIAEAISEGFRNGVKFPSFKEAVTKLKEKIDKEMNEPAPTTSNKDPRDFFTIHTGDGRTLGMGAEVVHSLEPDHGHEVEDADVRCFQPFTGTLTGVIEKGSPEYAAIFGEEDKRFARELAGVENLARWEKKANPHKRAKLWR